jgi:hypothetical protein
VTLHLHYWPTPNGKKATIFLEEAELPYELIPCDIGRGDQRSAIAQPSVEVSRLAASGPQVSPIYRPRKSSAVISCCTTRGHVPFP